MTIKNDGLFVVKGYENQLISFTMYDKNVDQYYELNKTYNNFLNSIKSVILAKTWSELFTSALQIKFKVDELYTKLKDFHPRELDSRDKDLIIPKKRGFS